MMFDRELVVRMIAEGTPLPTWEECVLSAESVVRNIQAEALRDWATFQLDSIEQFAYVADDLDRAEADRWARAARAFADRIEKGESC